jgi:hypothetical protein
MCYVLNVYTFMEEEECGHSILHVLEDEFASSSGLFLVCHGGS